MLTGLIGSTRTLKDGTEITADAGYVRESILHPTAKVLAGYDPVMPTFAGQIDEDGVAALLAYITSLEGEQDP